MTTETREIERKYDAAPGLVLPPLGGLPRVAEVSGAEPETLTAEYYDTDDLRLIKAGITLRRREGGADEGWHLKLPDQAGAANGASSRRELRVPLRRRGSPVPRELARLVLAHTRGAALRPVARVETRRRLTTLRDSAGRSLAEVAEDEVAAQSLGSSATLSRWNEVEVELTAGGPRLLRAADERLRNAGLRPSARSAKLERALGDGLPSTGRREAGRGGRLTAGSPSGAVMLAYVADQTARLKALDVGVRRDEPDAIHQMRVTARRLRSTLQAFPAIWPSSAGHLKDELKWLGQVLGGARDTEVLGEYFEDALAGLPEELVMGPVKARTTVYFAPQKAATRTSAIEALDSRRYLAMLSELDTLLARPPRTKASRAPARDVLPDALARAYRRTRRRMRQARGTPAGPRRDIALHEARKAAKRARYAAEAVASVFGKDARRFAKRMKKVQSVLGDQHDDVTAREVARVIGIQAHLAGENAFTFGLLNERAHQDALRHEDQARQAWKRAARPKSVKGLGL